MKRTVLGATLVTVATLVILQLAYADKASFTDPSTDASPPSSDIVAAKVKHAKNGDLIHSVQLEGSLAEGPPDSQVLLQFDLGGDPQCEFEFIWPPAGESHLVQCGVGPKRKTGKIKQVGDDTLKFTFDPKVIGNPDSYRWRMMTRGCGGECSVIDAFPDERDGKQVYKKHKLR
jgi:hypothetical protein